MHYFFAARSVKMKQNIKIGMRVRAPLPSDAKFKKKIK
jgi:hypothetical protein